MKFILLLLTLISSLKVYSNIFNLDHFEQRASRENADLYSNRGNYFPPIELFEFDELNQIDSENRKKQRRELKRIKYFLINGDLKLAATLLSKMAFSNSKLRPIIYRYLGTIYFLNGNFHQSYYYFDSNQLDEFPHFSKICLLKVFNQIILNKTDELESNWSRCKIENYEGINKQASLWVDILVELKIRPRFGITKSPFKDVRLSLLNNSELKTFLKLALYLNQEKVIVSEIPGFSFDQLRDSEIREIIGHALFRMGSFAKAYQYLEDLKSPNAENIKGNLYVLREKYELAYAQFKLALDKKQNSNNALERLAPLSWILKDWENGAKYSAQLISSPDMFIQKLILESAFYVQSGDLEKAEKLIEKIEEKSQKSSIIQVSQIRSFINLMLNKSNHIYPSAYQSCEQFDLNNCWLLYQLYQWENIHFAARKDGEIKHQSLWKTLSSETIDQSLSEKVYINQNDIEELDEKDEIEKKQKIEQKETKTEV